MTAPQNSMQLLNNPDHITDKQKRKQKAFEMRGATFPVVLLQKAIETSNAQCSIKREKHVRNKKLRKYGGLALEPIAEIDGEGQMNEQD